MTQKKITQEELNELLAEVIKEALDVDIPVPSDINPKVRINRRTTSTLGKCKEVDGQWVIEISEYILECEPRHIKSILAHEVIHTCDLCHNHLKLWKEYAEIMNGAYGYNIERLVSLESIGIEDAYAKTRIKYIMKCKACGKEYPRQRYTCVMKKINAYRCSCGGELTIIELNQQEKSD